MTSCDTSDNETLTIDVNTELWQLRRSKQTLSLVEQ
jgi:hypothetical protein